MNECVTIEFDSLEAFRSWLGKPERNGEKGFASTTIKRYVDAMRNLQAARTQFNVPSSTPCLYCILDHAQFVAEETRIRNHPYFNSYNNNSQSGAGVNLNGTGKGDPSAALLAFNKFLKDGLVAIRDLQQKSFEEEFGEWYLKYQCQGNNKTETNSTVRHYRTGLKAISQDQGEKDSQKWCGMYEYLFGTRPSKHVFQIGTKDEFEHVYGKFACVFSAMVPGDVDAAKHQECYKYTKGPRDASYLTDHGNLSAAFSAYRKFLEWREKQKTPEELPPNVDRLTLALKLFEDKRALPVPGKEKSFDKLLAETREQGAKIDGDYLVGCDYEAFRKTLNDRQVANAFFSKHTEDEKRRLGDFIAGVKNEPKDVSYYLANLPDVSGVGDMMLTAFLTRTRPDLYAFYSNQMFESVKFLGLTNDAALPVLTPDSYNTYKGIQTTIRDRMREMEIKAENGSAADYLTVNEFTWFVSEYQDQIKEKVMSKEFKDAPKKAKPSKRKLSEAVKDDDMLQRLMAALRTKPFAILAGHSGTGKSQLVRRLAYMTCNDEELAKDTEKFNAPGNYCMVQVKPNWHDSTDLLGYYTEMNGGNFHTTPFVEFICKAYAYPETPFFVCLDDL